MSYELWVMSYELGGEDIGHEMYNIISNVLSHNS